MEEQIFWRWFIDPPMRVGWRTLRALFFLAAFGGATVIAREHWTLPPITWAAESAALNGIILTFLIGFRNKASYDRWWEGRILWGKLVNDSRNLCLKYREYARPSAYERRLMTDRISEFAVALKNHLRSGMEKLARNEPGARHEALEVAGDVHAEIARLVAEKRVDSIQAQMLDLNANGLMDVSGACERIRGTPLADSYRALLRHGMIFALLAIMALTTWEMGALGIPAVLLPAYFLIAMELVAEDIENPFGARGDDLSLDVYCATIRRSAEQILIHSEAKK